MPKEEMSDHDLLIRIDERLEAIHHRLDKQDERLDKNDAECTLHKARTQELEAWKNRIVGFTIGAGAAAGALATLIYNALSWALSRG